MDIIQEQPAIEILPTDQGGTSKDFTPPAEESDSLSAHIEDFHAPAVTDDEPPKPELKPRHRAAKDRARPEDVPRIQALSAEVKEWKAKYEQAIAKGQTPAAATQTATQQTETAKPSTPVTVTDKPTWGAFEEQIGTTYATWGQAQDAYIDAREEWKESAAVAKTQQAQQQASEKAIEQEVVGKQTRYSEQLDAYVKAHPERMPAFQNIPNATPIMLETIWAMDNAPDVVYKVRNTPGLFEEMSFLTRAQPLSPETVAAATTWLNARLQAGTTGAAAGGSYSPKAPRPPTPVRTMPLPPPSAPPGDSASLLEHNIFYKTAR